ncbi:PAS domain S-box protein [Azohydromonas aeria]|uniref:PAS domain S-box protein n=1 Tax=Azohydromonas aeria TaxID=2590212 RepID=UPI0012FB1EA5|nr:PAS domain S-box protein [Azohydromonas aeria]
MYQDRFEALFEQAPFSIQLLDPSGRTLRVNRAWLALWQVPDSQEFLHWILTEYNILEDAQLRAKGVLPYVRRAFEGETVSIPPVFYDPAEMGRVGRACWVRSRLQPVLGDDGRVQEVMLIHEDVTEQVRFRDSLADSERRLQRVFDVNPIGMVTGDGSGRLHAVNDAFLRIVGRSREEFERGELRWDAITLPEYLARDAQAVEQAQREGVSAVYEKEYLRGDGTRVPVMLAVAHFGEPPEELLAFVIDIAERKRVENTLSAVLESLPVGVGIADPDGRLVRMNAANRALWGGALLDSQRWQDYGEWVAWWPETGQRVRAEEWTLARALLKGEAICNELVRIQPFDGSAPRYTLNNAAPVRDAGGTLLGAVVAQQDVTQQREAEQRLRESQAQLQAVFDAAPVGLIFAEAPSGRVVAGNRRAEEIFGHPMVPTASVQEYAQYGGLHADDRPFAPHEYPMARVLAGEAQVEVEMRYRRGDGRVVWLRVHAAPLLDAEGCVAGAMTAFLDISQERLALQALQEHGRELATSQQRLDLALEAGGMGVWDWTLATGESVWSRQMYVLVGLPIDPQGRGRADDVFDRVHPEDRPALDDKIARALAQSGEFDAEFRILRADGQLRWLCGHGKVIRDAAGQAERMLGLNFDITERRAIEQQLRETNERRTEFLAMLAHELRNPLALITNAVRLLDMELAPEQHHVVVEMVRRQSAHMARLVDDLLEVSRVTQGRIELKKERLLLAHALLPALEAAQPLAREQGQALVFDVPLDIELEADPARLTQIAGNLLTNAVKYTPAGGHVRLSARVLDRWVEIEVKDDGLGLDKALLPRVFDLFAQGATTLDRSRGGLGLGLTLVRRLAQLHGGEAKAASPGPGQGSTFTVRLPCLRSAEAQFAPAMPATPPRLAPTTLLVVDDNADAADSLALLLQMDGHTVKVARSGPEGLDMARQWQPRVLLLDLGLPGMDGYAVARALRAGPATAGVAIVALSGYGQESDREKTRVAGFDAHLVKPVDLEEICRVLALALDPSTLARQSAASPGLH